MSVAVICYRHEGIPKNVDGRLLFWSVASESAAPWVYVEDYSRMLLLLTWTCPPIIALPTLSCAKATKSRLVMLFSSSSENSKSREAVLTSSLLFGMAQANLWRMFFNHSLFLYLVCLHLSLSFFFPVRLVSRCVIDVLCITTPPCGDGRMDARLQIVPPPTFTQMKSTLIRFTHFKTATSKIYVSH